MGLLIAVGLALAAPREFAWYRATVAGPELGFLLHGQVFALRNPSPGADGVALYHRHFGSAPRPEPSIALPHGGVVRYTNRHDSLAKQIKALPYQIPNASVSYAAPSRWYLSPHGLYTSDRDVRNACCDHYDRWKLRAYCERDGNSTFVDEKYLWRTAHLGAVEDIVDTWALPWIQSEANSEELERRRLIGSPREIADRMMHYHFVPTARDRLRLFVLFRGQIHVFDGWEDKWEKVETFLAGFDEHFTPFLHGNDYYFVTRSRKLFAAPDPGKGLRESTRVRLPGDLTAHTVIRDINGDRAFCFGPAPEGNGRWFCLELAADAKPRFFDRSPVPAATDCKEPMRTTYELATWLKGQGLVK
jgi:hypothetical protein